MYIFNIQFFGNIVIILKIKEHAHISECDYSEKFKLRAFWQMFTIFYDLDSRYSGRGSENSTLVHLFILTFGLYFRKRYQRRKMITYLAIFLSRKRHSFMQEKTKKEMIYMHENLILTLYRIHQKKKKSIQLSHESI